MMALRRGAAFLAVALCLSGPSFPQSGGPIIPGGGGGSGCTMADPTATSATAAVNGSATTCMRSDAAPALGTTTGSGGIVRATSPALVTPTGIVKGDVALGSVDNTSDATKNAASVTLTNKTISGASNTLSAVATGSLATVQGNGTKVQLSTGTTTTNNCVKYDANGNTVDSGAGCGSGANPSASLGLSAVNGSATTFMRSDGAPALSQSIVPTWTGAHTFNSDVFGRQGGYNSLAFSFVGTTTGIYGGSNQYNIQVSANVVAQLTDNSFNIQGAKFGLSAPGSSISDIIVTRKAAANWQFGAADAAAPVAQTTSVQSVVAGTSNTAGTLWKFSDSIGTGSATSGGFEFDVHPLGGSGTAQNAASAALTISGAGLVATPLITSDSTHTDSSVCQDTTTHALYSGSGTLGVCLGTSSARFKRNIIPGRDGIVQILALQPKNFFYRKGYGDSGAREQYGFVAEDVVKILPKLVTVDRQKRPNTVDMLGMVPVLVRAMQEQQAQIKTLQARIATLERKH